MSLHWKLCNACKNPLSYGGIYYVCSISTCRGHATNYTFCSVPCWDGHLVVERHRPNAYAIEKRAPKNESEAKAMESKKSTSPKPVEDKRRVVVTGGGGKTSVDGEVLVVASKVKKYVSEKYGLNTSASVMEVLTKEVKKICDRGAEGAKRAGRKTLLDRDF